MRKSLTTRLRGFPKPSAMSPVTQIHRSKQPRRPHYIQEWAELRGFETQAALAAELDIDKSVVSRWFSGTSPSFEHQARLAALFGCEPEALFRHPNDDWFANFFRGRRQEEIDRMKTVLEASFPRKSGSSEQ